MDASVSSHVDSSLNDSFTDGENCGEAGQSPAAPPQVHTHKHIHTAEKKGVLISNQDRSWQRLCFFSTYHVRADVGGARVSWCDCCPADRRSGGTGPRCHPAPTDLCHTGASSADCPGENMFRCQVTGDKCNGSVVHHLPVKTDLCATTVPYHTLHCIFNLA